MTMQLTDNKPLMQNPRVPRIATHDVQIADLIGAVVRIAIDGLPRMFDPSTGRFCFSVRRTASGACRPVGESVRYTAIVLLGAHWLSDDDQRRVFRGTTARECCDRLIEAVDSIENLGDVALIAWAAAQMKHDLAARAFLRLRKIGAFGAPCFTVEAAWIVSAMCAGAEHVSPDERRIAMRRLLKAAGPYGLFPHRTSPTLSLRSHVGCFADQVYPIQALSRLHMLENSEESLMAAERCAQRICELQGEEGQWWWHYHSGTGRIVEGYPVYSVHQNSMAPMALLDLEESGGTAFDDCIRSGLRWLTSRPESTTELLDLNERLIWRKVGRGDPAKLVRRTRALTSRLMRVSPSRGFGRTFPARHVDFECRPYHLGWILLTWLQGQSK